MQDDPSTSPLTHSATLRRLLYEALDALGLDPTRVYRSVYRRIRCRRRPWAAAWCMTTPRCSGPSWRR